MPELRKGIFLKGGQHPGREVSLAGIYRDYENAEVKYEVYDKQTFPPTKFEYVANHKHINLNSQKYKKCFDIISKLKTGDKLVKDLTEFPNSVAIGLAKQGEGNTLFFSRKFLEEDFVRFQKRNYDFSEATVEYLVYWYDVKDNKEYKIILPRLFFTLKKSEDESKH